MNHEGIGADWLRTLGFPVVTCMLVRRHVDAKRYLCHIDGAYAAGLSEASR